MSISTKSTVVGRIKEATRESPIAVFRAVKLGSYDAVFAGTYTTQKLIAQKSPDLIGVYYGDKGVNDFVSAVKGENIDL